MLAGLAAAAHVGMALLVLAALAAAVHVGLVV